ncbi:MAG: ABC transporter permease [Candidatus Riflemargulisbacteria bacterium]
MNWRRIRYLIQKEFRQIFREKLNLVVIFGMPFIQLVVLGFAITLDVKSIPFVVVDADHSSMSREIVRSFTSTEFFAYKGTVYSAEEAIYYMDNSRAKMSLIIPSDFGQTLALQKAPEIQVLLDGVDGNSAGIASAYAGQVVASLPAKLYPETSMPTKQVMLVPRMLYNPLLESKLNIIPGIISMLLTMITLFLTAVNLVKEKEAGTLEQIMVTPIKPLELMIGKILPFGVLGFVLLNIGILTSGLIFGIWLKGNLFLLYGISILYMFTTLGLGLLFSTIATSQLQAMLMSLFFSIFSILLSGFFIPISNMPEIIQNFTYLIPLRYFMEIVRAIYLKSAGFLDLLPAILALVIYGSVALWLASKRFWKRIS